eukprot:TRINITY_DN500_c0_g1_i1.p1 TRINITY_DN500_c0_g1~~TRINITY_DN500_c0_g1_i1.p1  ORF type:complete len:337 (+),score=40.68 TRINITY_DN500_c0_g1_i1:87-1013(+)
MAAPAESLPPESCSSPARQSGWDLIGRHLHSLSSPQGELDPGLALGCPGVPMAAALWCMLRMPSRVALPEDLLAVCAAFLRREWLVVWWNKADPTVTTPTGFGCGGELVVQGPMPFSEAELFAGDHPPCSCSDSFCSRYLFCRGGNLEPRPSTDGWHLAGRRAVWENRLIRAHSGRGSGFDQLRDRCLRAELEMCTRHACIIAHPVQGDGREYELVAEAVGDVELSRQHPPCRIFRGERSPPPPPPPQPLMPNRFIRIPSPRARSPRQLALCQGWRAAQQRRALPPRRPPPRAKAGSAARQRGRGQRR